MNITNKFNMLGKYVNQSMKEWIINAATKHHVSAPQIWEVVAPDLTFDLTLIIGCSIFGWTTLFP